MFAVLTLVPAAPAATEPCTCALNWTDPDSGHACREPQFGCPPVACDGPYPPWCVVESLPCADPDPDSGINTGLYGGNWIHCEPEYSPTPPSYPPPPPFAVVRIGALLPRQLPSGELMHLGRAEELTSVLMAIEEINNKTDGVADDLLPNTQLLLAHRDSRCDPAFGSDAAYQLLHHAFDGAGCDALVGAYCSSASIPAARLAELTATPQVSHSSQSPELSGDDFPFFARVVTSDSLMAVALAEATRNLLGVKRVATIACTDAYCTAGVAAFEAAASAQGITIIESVRFENGQSNLGEPLGALRASCATVFVAIALAEDADRLLEQALGARLVGPEFTWVGDIGLFEGLGSLAGRGLPVDDFRGILAITNSIAPSVAYDGYASRKRARPSTLGDGTNCDPADDDEGHKLWSVDTDEDRAPRCFGANNQFPESVYAPRAYDAVYAVAHAVQALVDDPLVQRIDGDALMAALLAVRFDGVTGKVSFSSEPATLGDRAGGVLYDVMNVNASGAWVKLGTWQPADNWEQSFAGNGQALTRPTPDNSKPPELVGDTLRVGVFCDDHVGESECQHVMHIIDRINDKKDGFLDDLLPDHTLFYSMVQTGTTGCAESEAIRSQFDQLYSDLNGVVATIGPFCSDDVAAVTAAEWRAGADVSTVVLSPSSTAPILANVGAYPNLLRLSSNDKHIQSAVAALAERLGWQAICVLHDDGLWGRGVMQSFTSIFESSGGKIVNNGTAEFSKAAFDGGNLTGSDLLDQLEDCQIILLAAYPDAQRAVFAASYDEGRLWGPGYAWLNVLPAEEALYNADGSVNSLKYQALWDEVSSSQGCTNMSPQSRPFCDHDDDASTLPDYTAMRVDAVIKLAVSADAAIRNGSRPGDADALYATMLAADTVTGLSGPLVFDDSGDRLGTLEVLNYRLLTEASQSGRRLSSVLLPRSLLEFSIVGSYSTATSTLQLPDVGALVFSGGSTEPVQLEPLTDGNKYHLFLSHSWLSGQDAVRVMKERLLNLLPDTKIFLDVDDLASGRGAAEVAMSKILVVFLSDGYLTRPNTVRELLRAMSLQKIVITVYDERSVYMDKGVLRAAIEAACLNLSRWGLDGDLAAWGAEVPTTADIFAALTAQPLLWTRVPAFMNVTLQACVTPLVQPKAPMLRPSADGKANLSPEALQRTVEMLVQPKALILQSVPSWAQKGLGRADGKASLSPEALERAIEMMQAAAEPGAAASTRLYTRAGIGFTWQRLRAGERFRIYASPHNPGALELTQELSCLLQHLDIELEVTTSVADLTACSHMLLYLDKRTWTDDDQRIAALSSDVKAALAGRVHLLLVHESEPFEYMAGSHAGVKFDDLLDCVDGATPIELLQRQVYAEVAVPLKEGIYRPASLLLLARAVGDQTRTSALRQLTFSSKELRLPSMTLAEGSASLMSRSKHDPASRQNTPHGRRRALPPL
ncbi:hypothetical protein EMIHUDRAFT_451652 [Emiliania huxleyi CCMP1516]|uniref:Receptor ligand binding region domain-containing protein n=2 Tax=Emiliania huxleyi TaxID=2903 RepID=A0A0D3IWJ0_EMIH1|nr:hypothetical protein EMIHUDRAFT_451652 [Emiliania huxleyi CCMP1516]EOD15625.1 hypothetical protein EMIHUDRAFT_451652 [Emiliania huxleyi CCMP1516]|eukprot:XP_005768054.1 hypothetical protein EMIHUDRAFT_451652 [Emiliania huxleyi CCMP1516]